MEYPFSDYPFCDRCGKEFKDKEDAHVFWTDRTHDALPVIELLCTECNDDRSER